MKRARLWKKLMLVPAGLLVGLLLMELFLYFASYSYPLPYVTDPYCAARLRPSFGAWFTNEGSCYVKTNSHGNRDVERAFKKKEGVLRIAVLGDSFAEARQLPIEKTFWNVLEKNLAKQLHREVEVLNFGVSGYSTVQELQLLRNHVWQFEPDVVLLAFYTGNDLRNNSKKLEGDQVKPFYVLDGDRMVLDNSFREHPLYLKCQTNWVKFKSGLINRSRVLQVISESRSRGAQPTSISGLKGNYLKPPSKPAWHEAWDLTERVILMMHENVQSHHAQFWLVTLSADIQVHPDAQVRKEFCETNKVNDLLYPDKRLRAFAQKRSIESVMLAEPLQRMADETGVYLHGFSNTKMGRGHWNENGHRAAGKLIAEVMGKRLGTANER